jgi:predicted nucleic acid-binding protein
VRKALSEPDSWVIADQVWFELYRLLRNPNVLSKPLDARRAAEAIDWYRNKSGWRKCSWECKHMSELSEAWKEKDFPARRVFDLVLAVTLRENGVDELYTRNIADFTDRGFRRLINPLE